VLALCADGSFACVSRGVVEEDDMASLKGSKLEDYLEIKTGYVCDFSNRTFEEFVLEHTGIEFYSDKYSSLSASTA
jgi:hypothetical protein